MKKKITIIICNFNNEKFIKKCLFSVINQKKNKNSYNIIFVDDKSVDKSLLIAKKILKKFENSLIIENKSNLGLIKSCNKAIKNCRTDYFIRVDSDDYISKYLIFYFEKTLKEKKYDLISCKRVNFKNKKMKKINISEKNIDLFKLVSCGVALKTKKVKDIGMYKNMLWEEYDLYLRYLKKNQKNIKIINRYLYYYRKHNKSMSSKKNWIKKAWKQLIRKYSKKKLLYFGKLPINLMSDMNKL